ncbi:hypothetical protein FZEAL_7727 [Fusarium zealandicum]|uniref:Uncharacterized protein n=1 Tax=Fusarium zealandicum TaxID=1053134 RepID=A0A8H4XID2_9HYPO|nr:hypothetical protein FZEAL_7727 [Fusarium zealandicum]
MSNDNDKNNKDATQKPLPQTPTRQKISPAPVSITLNRITRPASASRYGPLNAGIRKQTKRTNSCHGMGKSASVLVDESETRAPISVLGEDSSTDSDDSVDPAVPTTKPLEKGKAYQSRFIEDFSSNDSGNATFPTSDWPEDWPPDLCINPDIGPQNVLVTYPETISQNGGPAPTQGVQSPTDSGLCLGSIQGNQAQDDAGDNKTVNGTNRQAADAQDVPRSRNDNQGRSQDDASLAELFRNGFNNNGTFIHTVAIHNGTKDKYKDKSASEDSLPGRGSQNRTNAEANPPQQPSLEPSSTQPKVDDDDLSVEELAQKVKILNRQVWLLDEASANNMAHSQALAAASSVECSIDEISVCRGRLQTPLQAAGRQLKENKAKFTGNVTDVTEAPPQQQPKKPEAAPKTQEGTKKPQPAPSVSPEQPPFTFDGPPTVPTNTKVKKSKKRK